MTPEEKERYVREDAQKERAAEIIRSLPDPERRDLLIGIEIAEDAAVDAAKRAMLKHMQRLSPLNSLTPYKFIMAYAKRIGVKLEHIS